MRPNRSGCPANGKLRSAGGPCPLNYLENRDCRSSQDAQMGTLSQRCQQTRRCQRRNRRVRAVERGQRSEPAWLRAHPGRNHFEPEKLARTQILRNVWDTGAAGMGNGVNEIGGIKLAFWTVAPHLGHVSNSIRKPTHCIHRNFGSGEPLDKFATWRPGDAQAGLRIFLTAVQ